MPYHMLAEALTIIFYSANELIGFNGFGNAESIMKELDGILIPLWGLAVGPL